MSILESERNFGGPSSNLLVEETDRKSQAGSSTWSQAQAQKDSDGPSNTGKHSTFPANLESNAVEDIQHAGDAAPDDTAETTPSEIPRTIGDFNDNANSMWSLHLGEAKSHDEARIHSLKDDMDGVLIFVRSYISIIVFFP